MFRAKRIISQNGKNTQTQNTKLAHQKLKSTFSTLTFDQISDVKKRDYFNAIPTSFRLDKKQVTSIKKLAGELLEKSPEFQNFKKSTEN